MRSVFDASAVALLALLCSCRLASYQAQSRDWAVELVPADASAMEATTWRIGAWSGGKGYDFDSGLESQEYRSWVEAKLKPDWHCHAATATSLDCSRLTGGEQQFLNIRLRTTPAQKLHVRLAILVTAT